MTFTADNLPEAARSMPMDPTARFDNGMPLNLNGYTARVLNRLDAAHGGRLSALLNGLAPAFTDEPPEVTDQEAAEACNFFWEDEDAELPSMRKILQADRARVWQTHRPKPADPVRFALEKVDMQALCEVARKYSGTDNGIAFVSEQNRRTLVTELARILPVAEPVKPWAELTGDEAYRMACEALAANALRGNSDDALTSLRASLSAYAPPPRKVEVTFDVMAAFDRGWRDTSYAGYSDEPEFNDFIAGNLAGVRAALAVANSQAEAREIEAVAELARLRDMVAQLERQIGSKAAVLAHPEIQALLNKIGFIAEQKADQAPGMPKAAQDQFAVRIADVELLKQELSDLRAHADRLEAMLTVPGVDGPVKLWEGFDVQLEGYLTQWVPGAFVPSVTWGSRSAAWTFANFYESHSLPARRIRQSPAPAAEPRKRWRYPLSSTSTVYVTTDAPCSINDLPEAARDLAVEVIGEAGK